MKQMERRQTLLPSGRFWKALERQARGLPLSCVTPAVREGWGPGPPTVTPSKLKGMTAQGPPWGAPPSTHLGPSRQEGRLPGGPGSGLASPPLSWGHHHHDLLSLPPLDAAMAADQGRSQMFKQKPQGPLESQTSANLL